MRCFEVIREIKNLCGNNQMRDVFFDEIETDDPLLWVREQEPGADEITCEEVPGGYRIHVVANGLNTEYTVTEIQA